MTLFSCGSAFASYADWSVRIFIGCIWSKGGSFTARLNYSMLIEVYIHIWVNTLVLAGGYLKNTHYTVFISLDKWLFWAYVWSTYIFIYNIFNVTANKHNYLYIHVLACKALHNESTSKRKRRTNFIFENMLHILLQCTWSYLY